MNNEMNRVGGAQVQVMVQERPVVAAAAAGAPEQLFLNLRIQELFPGNGIVLGGAAAAAADAPPININENAIRAKINLRKQQQKIRSIQKAISTLMQQLGDSRSLNSERVRLWKECFQRAEDTETLVNTLGYLYHRIIVDNMEMGNDAKNLELNAMRESCLAILRGVLPQELDVNEFIENADSNSRNVRITRSAATVIQLFRAESEEAIVDAGQQIQQQIFDAERGFREEIREFRQAHQARREQMSAAVIRVMDSVEELHQETLQQGVAMISGVETFAARRDATLQNVMTTVQEFLT